MQLIDKANEQFLLMCNAANIILRKIMLDRRGGVRREF